MSERVTQLKDEMQWLLGCCLSSPPFAPDDIAEVLAWRWNGDYGGTFSDAPKEGADSSSYAVVKLSDGRFGVLEESEDYTGHGCQCNANAVAFPTLEEAILLGLSQNERDDYEGLGE